MPFQTRFALRATASLLAIVAGAAQAQEAAPVAAPAAAAADEEAVETIVVTGSRLVRDPNATAPLPVSTLNLQDLRAAGNSDVTATLRQIPALLSSGTVADSIERGGGGVGQATLNLRGLGSNRTLVLVDGRRHVSGVAGAQTVDVSTIPSALIERVEVLTGGASAVYGADAVTGVVNYVLRRDFDGLELDAQMGISSRGDGQSFRIEGTWGKNFAEGRGNITVSGGYTNDQEVLFGDRPFTANNGRGNNSTTYAHPDRRFQKGEISAAATPNFASRYRIGGPGPSSSDFPWGPSIPTAAQFTTFFPGKTPTAAEQALIDRAAASPLFKIGRDPRFAISSGQGLIFRADFDYFGTDINGNGTRDCNESFIGRTGFGGGGCYVSTPGGGVKVFEDGIISTGSNQFGGDGAVERTSQTSLIPGSQRLYANIKGQYEFAPVAEVFWDAKYARNKTTSRNNYNTFYDSLLIPADNPFIPAVLKGEADDAGGLRVSRDFLDLGPNIQESTRETYRFVGGVQGEIGEHLKYEFVGNYGRTDSKVTQGNTVRYDRLFAAIDAVRGPGGNIICRSDINSTPYIGSEAFPVIEGGFFTFKPGDGQCKPANILSGEQSVSAEAVAFITTPTTDNFRLEQTVFTLAFTGDTGQFLELPGGAIQFAAGGEYRKEKSRSTFSDLEKGLLPAGSPAGAEGTFIGDISDNQSLIFDAQTRTFDSGGEFDVKEVFGEISVPILKDRPFFYDLTLGAAGRYADYSTIGGAFTWNINGTWAPIRDVRFRGTYSKAIRAPNIAELFDPQQGATFRPNDPCNQSTIDGLIASGAAVAQNRLANCRAAGIPAGYEDPLTARFSGTTGGNPDLTEEEATTFTIGGVLQPSFVPGLTISVDYYSIKIENAIAAVSAQDIVNTCYDLDTFPNQFCGLFDRNPGTGATAYGFNFLRQTQLNFGRIETAGIDFQVDYGFSFGENDIRLRVGGNWTEKLNRFFDPVNESLVNPGLKELGTPEWSGLGSATWSRNGLSFTYRLQYIGEQAKAIAIQIERIDSEFGPDGYAKATWVHDIAASFDLDDRFQFYGGVNNLTNQEPFISSSAYPVSGMGRYYFVGARAKF